MKGGGSEKQGTSVWPQLGAFVFESGSSASRYECAIQHGSSPGSHEIMATFMSHHLLSGPSCPLHLTGVSSDLLGGGDGAEATSVLLMPGGVCTPKISSVWQSPLLQRHTAALHHAGKRDPAQWIRKACGSRGSEVTARDAQRGRHRLETVISSACESDVQLWEKQL